MHFPVMIHMGRWTIPPHQVFESLAYFIGARVYFATRKKSGLSTEKGLWIVVGAVVGAAIGAKVLSWLENPAGLIQHISDPQYWMGGQTIVGALLGGLVGVELAKKRVGHRESTGDDFVLPLTIGICVGRVGCFLAGLPDHTYGTPTRLFTGIDFGDGIPRHPTQLYEIVFLCMWVCTVFWMIRRFQRGISLTPMSGFRFQLFMFGYLGFRLLVEFIKPTPHPYFGLSNIQLACIAGMMYYTPKLSRCVWSLCTQPQEVG